MHKFSTSPLRAGGAVVAEDDITNQMGVIYSKAANGDTSSSHV